MAREWEILLLRIGELDPAFRYRVRGARKKSRSKLVPRTLRIPVSRSPLRKDPRDPSLRVVRPAEILNLVQIIRSRRSSPA